MMVRLQKFLADAGVASRRQSELLMQNGRVKVNGQVIRELGTKVNPESDVVEVGGKKLQAATKFVYIKLHKPRDVITSMTSDQGASVADLVKCPQRVFPVGRLDKDASGLLLLTNDGAWMQQVAHPKYHWPKRYVVRLGQELSVGHEKLLRQGPELDGQKLASMRVLRTANLRQVITLELSQGINRHIRKVFGRLGYSVLSIHRIQIGPIALGQLRAGSWKYLTAQEVRQMRLFTQQQQSKADRK